jgi:hydrogenase maturation protease
MRRVSRNRIGMSSIGDHLTVSVGEFHLQGGSKLLRIIGIGSPFGDDQVGWRLVRELRESGRADLLAAPVATPISLLHHLDVCSGLIVIDACDAGLAPGTVVVRRWSAALKECANASTHGFGVSSALEMAERLGILPAQVFLFAVQKCRCEPSDDLSDQVKEAWPEIKSQLDALIGYLA